MSNLIWRTAPGERTSHVCRSGNLWSLCGKPFNRSTEPDEGIPCMDCLELATALIVQDEGTFV